MRDISTWMPLYPRDYLGDTGHLSTEQHGAYLLLLLHYWLSGKALPDDDVQLARITRLTPTEWAEHCDTVRAFFQARRGRLHHKRVDAEIRRAVANRKALSERGKKGAREKWKKAGRRTAFSDTDSRREKSQQNKNLDATAIAQAMPKGMLGDAPSPSPIKKTDPSGSENGSEEGDQAFIFGEGLAFLSAADRKGRETSALRRELGLWRTQVGDAYLAGFITQAMQNATSNPMGYVAAAVSKHLEEIRQREARERPAAYRPGAI